MNRFPSDGGHVMKNSTRCSYEHLRGLSKNIEQQWNNFDNAQIVVACVEAEHTGLFTEKVWSPDNVSPESMQAGEKKARNRRRDPTDATSAYAIGLIKLHATTLHGGLASNDPPAQKGLASTRVNLVSTRPVRRTTHKRFNVSAGSRQRAGNTCFACDVHA